MIVYIDPEETRIKPDKGEVGVISNRLITKPQEFNDPAQIYELLMNYHAIYPGRLKRINGELARSNLNWAGQRLFFLDFDNTKTITITEDGRRKKNKVISDKVITPQDVLEICKVYGLTPSFGYYTMSHIPEHPKFRVIFDSGIEIFDPQLRDIYQISLMRLFPECDGGCKDRARFFYGTRPGSEIWDIVAYENTQNIISLIESTVSYFEDHGKEHRNSARQLIAYCKEAGCDVIKSKKNIYPDIRPISAPELITKSDALGQNSYIIIRDLTHSVDFCSSTGGCLRGIVYHDEGRQWYKIKMAPIKKYTTRWKPVYNIDTVEVDKILSVLPLDDIYEHCSLYRDLCDKVELEHNERFHLACNFVNIKGGAKHIREVILDDSRYNPDWDRQMRRISTYQPTRCDEDRCPHYGIQCESAGNIIDTSRRGRGRIKVFPTTPQITLEEMDQQLDDKVGDIIFSESLSLDGPRYSYPDSDVYAIKAPTGSGKTERYLPLCEQSAIIAVPTHDLADEIYERMARYAMAIGSRSVLSKTPRLPDLGMEINNHIQRLYKAGAYEDAHIYLREVANSGNDIAKEYLREIEMTRSASGCLITTHERIMYYRGSSRGICVIDEDPMASILKEESISVNDLSRLKLAMTDGNYNDEQVRLVSNIHYEVMNTPLHIVKYRPSQLHKGTVQDITKVIVDNDIKGNVMGLIRSSLYVRHESNGEQVISFIVRRNLPENMRIVIMSATADKQQYERLLGTRLHWHDVGLVEHRGRIIQYTDNSLSRQQLSNKERHIDLAIARAGTTNTITFLKHKHHFPGAVGHFGACVGIDAFKGQDLFVIGTPHLHPISYILRAAALGEEALVIEDGTKYQQVRYNNMGFYFNCLDTNSEFIQHVQLSMVEAELIQAVGRARAMREDCTVTVMASLPVPGAEYYYPTRSEKDDILTDYYDKRDNEDEKDVA